MLNNLTIRSKLILLATVPLLIALYFGIAASVKAYQVEAEMSRISSLVAVGAKMSALVHESQKERGMTAGYLGSNGNKFAKELPQQQILFDQKSEDLKKALDQINQSLFGEKLRSLIDSSLQQLKKTDQVRQQVKSLKIPLGKALTHYTTLNKMLLSNIEFLTRITHDALIAEKIVAFSNLLQSKERAGIERAVLTNTFAQDRFAPGFYEKFIGLVTAQNTYMNVFETNATAENLAFYHQAMQDPSIPKVQKMRDIASQNAGTGGFGIDSQLWFKTITQKINQLKAIENHLTEDLIQTTDESASSAFYNLLIAIAIILVAFTFVIVLATLITREIHKSIERLKNTMRLVENTGDLSLQVEVIGKDEIADISSRFNHFIGTLKGIIDESNHVLAQVALGDFSIRVSGEAQGDLVKLKNGVNHSAESVSFTMNALTETMTAISNGDFSARMDEKIPSNFRNNVDNAMQSMDTAVTELINVIGKLSLGQFDGRIETELKGDMNRLKNNVNQSVEQLEVAMSEIIEAIIAQSSGDLTVQIEGNYQGELDRVKSAFNEGSANLNQVIGNVLHTANMVNNASQEVADGNTDLNDRTQNQAAALEETAAAMEELTSTIKHNTENASTADQLSSNARKQAERGHVVMQETIEAINEIRDSSSKIEEIIGLIDSIAFQTNLLALNAAVEAARAGEHGRGFAVVASEVRNLAGKSADAAKDIKNLIEQSSDSIANGSQKIDETSRVLQEINESIQEVGNIVSEISSASKEQQFGVEQVNQAITEIDHTTQQNAALVEETTAAAQSMSHESEQLKAAVAGFKTSNIALPAY
ncbi:methyl-accepting chemotaxis protein [Thiomicrorhabdus sp.]|uniref:methyl-accepting chemotaxis protein n=1 Tax=Thiomicrorhabdus sp. TaxID=2039724 RepID=UPI003563408F